MGRWRDGARALFKDLLQLEGVILGAPPEFAECHAVTRGPCGDLGWRELACVGINPIEELAELDALQGAGGIESGEDGRAADPFHTSILLALGGKLRLG